VRRPLVEHPTPGASPCPALLPGKASAAEVVATLAAGLLPADEGELIGTHITDHCGGGVS